MGAWQSIRKVWATLGAAALVIFTGWSVLAYRARPDAHEALRSDELVTVARGDGFWTFTSPRPSAVGLVFFPGGLVDPVAYAPIARAVAARNYPAVLVAMPRRGAFGGADGAEMFTRIETATRKIPHVARWVVAGHSRGGVLAARVVQRGGAHIAGVVLIGTSHPRDFSLAHITFPVTRVYGTRDTIADVEKLEATRHNLPAGTRLVRIDGGNHSQFGQYGFQPGDWPATIDRDTQQRLTIEAVLATLELASKAAGIP